MTKTEILNVNITDETGEIVADIDGSSTADAMAYYLSSRGIVPNATEESIRPSIYDGPTATIIVEQRGLFGDLLNQWKAEVH